MENIMSNSNKPKKVNWMTLDYDGEKYRIVRADGSNDKYVAITEKRLRPYKRQNDKGKLDPGIVLRLTAGIFADSVIIGWAGIKDEQGQELPFTRDGVIKRMLARPALFQDIQEQSRILENFSKEVVTTE